MKAWIAACTVLSLSATTLADDCPTQTPAHARQAAELPLATTRVGSPPNSAMWALIQASERRT